MQRNATWETYGTGGHSADYSKRMEAVLAQDESTSSKWSKQTSLRISIAQEKPNKASRPVKCTRSCDRIGPHETNERLPRTPPNARDKETVQMSCLFIRANEHFRVHSLDLFTPN